MLKKSVFIYSGIQAFRREAFGTAALRKDEIEKARLLKPVLPSLGVHWG